MLDKMADFPQSYPAFFVDEENTAKENSMVEQKHLSPVMILASIIFMSTFVPLSIDLYLPALPQMREYFQASEMLVNMTLIAFFLFFSVGIVLFGPISDKYGRKFSLLGGALVIYPGFSDLCDVRVCLCAHRRAYSAGIGSGLHSYHFYGTD